LKIAIISHYFGFGDGQGRVNYEIASAAVDAGIDVTLVAERCDVYLATHSRVRFIRIPMSSLPTRLLKNLSFAIRSVGWIRQNRKDIDVIQANGFVTFANADIIAAHFVHGAWMKSPYAAPNKKNWTLNTLYQRANTKINARLEQTAFRPARKIVAVSENVASELRSVKVPDSRIAVIFNGVDTVEFKPRESDRTLFSLPPNVPLFLFSGDIRTHRKNLDGVLRAVAQVEGAHLAVAGNLTGSPYPALAKDLGIAGRVHFLGHVKNISGLMAASDAFIFPSRYDPMGLVVLEAMATGLPVITAKTTGASAVLDDPQWTLDDPENLPELVRMARTLAEDPSLRKQVGERNRAIALNHTWHSMALAYLDLYRAIHDEKTSERQTR
jgi:glycosyltransferase involved in cell wall biosynthesis